MSLFDFLKRRVADKRPPDFVIGDHYLDRWWVVPRNRWANAYLHHFLQSDEDRALHDHMYFSCGVMLKGEYVEETIAAGGVHVYTRRRAGQVVFRSPWTAHRVIIEPGRDCWTLFLTGPRIRNWGFHCPKGWRPWQEFTAPGDSGKTGVGCD